MKTAKKNFIINFIAIAVICLVIPMAFKYNLERLIMDNYTKRRMGILPDKLYWADKLYMRLYGLNNEFYKTEAKKVIGND